MLNDTMIFEVAREDNEEIPAWKQLEEVCRKWAVLSQHENDLSNYQKMKELYQ
jgi:hypothetical protein